MTKNTARTGSTIDLRKRMERIDKATFSTKSGNQGQKKPGHRKMTASESLSANTSIRVPCCRAMRVFRSRNRRAMAPSAPSKKRWSKINTTETPYICWLTATTNANASTTDPTDTRSGLIFGSGSCSNQRSSGARNGCQKESRSMAGAATAALDVEVLDRLGMCLYEIFARFYFVAHQNGKYLIGALGILDFHLSHHAMLRVHGCFPQLVGVHFA